VLLVVPTAYFDPGPAARGSRPVVEFITLHAAGHPGDRHRLRLPPALQLVVVAAVDRRARWATDLLLAFGYATLALPYMYRAVDTGMRAIDARVADGGGREPRRRLG
jgi:putative spermidine/putrescine transport system permease protein